MNLKQLVNDKDVYFDFCRHLDDLIEIRQRTLETADDPVVMHRQQGAIDALRKMKLLRETVNGPDRR